MTLDAALVESINKLPLMQLYDVQSIVGPAIEKELRRLRASVIRKNEGKNVYLEHPENGTYICKNVAYAGRWRMWKMVQGVRGLKRGPMVVEEAFGDIDDLKIHVALGYYKDK